MSVYTPGVLRRLMYASACVSGIDLATGCDRTVLWSRQTGKTTVITNAKNLIKATLAHKNKNPTHALKHPYLKQKKGRA